MSKRAPRKRLTKGQLLDLLAYAQYIEDRQLGAAVARALDGDSVYNDSIQERCQSAYAGARRTQDFKAAVRRSRSKP